MTFVLSIIRFVFQASFTEAARDLGQPEFMNDLAVAIHQVSTSTSYSTYDVFYLCACYSSPEVTTCHTLVRYALLCS